MTIRSLFPAEVVTQEMSVPALAEHLHPAGGCASTASGRAADSISAEDGEFEPTAPLCLPAARVAFARNRYLLHEAYTITALVALIVEESRGL
jgi:hypothetical protein